MKQNDSQNPTYSLNYYMESEDTRIVIGEQNILALRTEHWPTKHSLSLYSNV